MGKLQSKSLGAPDEVRPFQGDRGRVELVALEAEHVKPIAGTDSCQVRHLGYVVSGRMKIVMDDGAEIEIGPGEVCDIPPGHDAWTVGEDACVLVDFGGLEGYAVGS